jgi:hypothetical protein
VRTVLCLPLVREVFAAELDRRKGVAPMRLNHWTPEASQATCNDSMLSLHRRYVQLVPRCATSLGKHILGSARLIGALALLSVTLSCAASAQSSAESRLRRCGCVYWEVPDCMLLRTRMGETFNIALARPAPIPGNEICLSARRADKYSFCPGRILERISYRYTGFRCELRPTAYRKYR